MLSFLAFIASVRLSWNQQISVDRELKQQFEQAVIHQQWDKVRAMASDPALMRRLSPRPGEESHPEIEAGILWALINNLHGPGQYGSCVTAMRIAFQNGAAPAEGRWRAWWYALYADSWGQAVDLFLSHGANPNASLESPRPGFPSTTVMACTVSNQVQNLRKLLDRGADPDRPSYVYDGYFFVFPKATLPQGLDPDHRTDFFSVFRPLSIAARYGKIAILETLLLGGMRPVPDAAQISDEELDRRLAHLSYPGADVNARDPKTGMTALHHAAETDQLRAIQILLDFKAKFLKDARGRTPYDAAKERKSHHAMAYLKMILDSGKRWTGG